VGEHAQFEIPVDTQQVILETRQSTEVSLTTKLKTTERKYIEKTQK